MQPKSTIGVFTFAAALTAAAMSGACGGNNEEQPAVSGVQSQTPPQAVNRPATITGCLRSGDASDTFVLTATRSEDKEEPATYHLVGSGGANLRDHVGKRVEVSGTVTAQQQASGRALDTSAERATGTSGTPSVTTRTEVDVKRLEVTSIRPLGESCGDDR